MDQKTVLLCKRIIRGIQQRHKIGLRKCTEKNLVSYGSLEMII